MQVMPHIYYTLKATDLLLPADMKNRQEYGFGLKNIPAAVNKRENPFDRCFIMSDEKEQKSSRELITLTKNFCSKLHDVSDDYTAYPYERQTYKITMCRNAMVFIFDSDLGGTCASNIVNLPATDTGTFSFIYNKANKIIYASNIREILNMDLQCLRIYEHGEDNHVSFDRLSRYLNPNTTPLYVYAFNNDKNYGLEAFVRTIPDDMVVVNENMCEIYPQVTRHIPAGMSLLFNKKTEPVKRAYGKEYWHGNQR